MNVFGFPLVFRLFVACGISYRYKAVGGDAFGDAEDLYGLVHAAFIGVTCRPYGSEAYGFGGEEKVLRGCGAVGGPVAVGHFGTLSPLRLMKSVSPQITKSAAHWEYILCGPSDCRASLVLWSVTTMKRQGWILMPEGAAIAALRSVSICASVSFCSVYERTLLRLIMVARVEFSVCSGDLLQLAKIADSANRRISNGCFI